jgi:hypothetical protein
MTTKVTGINKKALDLWNEYQLGIITLNEGRFSDI